MQQEVIGLDPVSLAGQCIDIYFCSGCCTSVVSFWASFASLTKKKPITAARVDFTNSGKSRPHASWNCAMFRGLFQPEDTAHTLVGEQRQSHRYLSLDSSICITRVGNQTVPLLSNCPIFLFLSVSFALSLTPVDLSPVWFSSFIVNLCLFCHLIFQ